MRRTAVLLIAVMALFMSGVLPAVAQEGVDREVPASVDDLKLSSPITRSGVTSPSTSAVKIDSSLLGVSGRTEVMVRLTADAPAARAADGGAAQRSALADVKAQQDGVIDRATGLNARILAQAQRASNIVVMDIDASQLEALAADPAIESIRPVIDYELDLTETVPYIGAAAVQDLGYDGSGVSVAVLDSGVDYTHAALGGSGDVADYENNDPNIIEKGTFPTAKVVGGYDFVGSEWPDAPEAPDPDPIDDGPQAGHGTHVADIIGGTLGVAPGADIYAVKVCSSVSTSCSGIALIQGMDFAVDPNGDGDTSDHVDIINMSLGASYGQPFDDDLSQAVENATAAGVLTVASAGNSADLPYITGSPAAAPSALSVAQTQVPSAILPLLDFEGTQFPGVFQPWSVYPTEVITGDVVYGDGAGGNLNGCEAHTTDLTGAIVLIDRGACNFTLKALNAQNAGAAVAIIGLVDGSDPFPGGDGGDGPITIPSFMISLANADLIRGGGSMTIDPATGLPLIGQMVGSSSRGPSMSYNTIKPEIGAPGASVSAVAGSGDGTGPFGGTSGAAPMVSGAAALLLQANPDRIPAEIKSVLMNTGDTDILTEPVELGGVAAPITRIGGGEVRVDEALAAPAAAWDSELLTGALSFGFHDVYTATVRETREVTVRNYTKAPITYSITPTFRYADDADNGAVGVSAPSSVRVPANGVATFNVTLTVDGAALRDWGLNSGSAGGSGDTLSVYEYDGYLLLDDAKGDADLHLAWQVLPRKSGAVTGDRSVAVSPTGEGYDLGTGELVNRGVGTSAIEAFSLIGRSPNIPEGGIGEQSPVVDLRYVGVATFPVPAGFCSADDSFVMQFAVNTWERQTHANAPALFEFDLDTNQDGIVDYAVFNGDFLGDGRNVTLALDVATGEATIFFLTGHNTNSANTVLTICGEQIGMNAANFGQMMTADVLAVDAYFQGVVTDFIGGLQIAPLGERFLGLVDPIAGGDTGELTVVDFGRRGTNPSEFGLLLFTTGAHDDGLSGAPEGREALAVRVRPAKAYQPPPKHMQ